MSIDPKTRVLYIQVRDLLNKQEYDHRQLMDMSHKQAKEIAALKAIGRDVQQLEVAHNQSETQLSMLEKEIKNLKRGLENLLSGLSAEERIFLEGAKGVA